MMKNLSLCLLTCMCSLLFAAPAPQFEPVPDEALEILKGVRGKSVDAGFAFVNGHYIKPPYRIARFGTAIFVNNYQITGQIVPWQSFLATQNGYVPPVKKIAPPPRKKVAPPSVKDPPKSLDDLFDEAPKVTTTPPSQATPEPAEKSSLPNFEMNARCERFLKTINAYRLDVQRKLRSGCICFFGTRTGRIDVDPQFTSDVMAVLPEAMRDATHADNLVNTLRAKGFSFVRREVCEDLLENRADYLQLQERRKAMEDDEEIHQLIKKNKGRGR